MACHNSAICCSITQNEHPCALTCFEDMMSSAQGKRIVVFLDYDGTLSPIVNDPDSAFMSNQVRYFTPLLFSESLVKTKLRKFCSMVRKLYADALSSS